MLEPLQDEFMRRAIVEVVLIGIAGGTLGCWVVLYRFSYAAESLAHSIFPGLVIAALAGLPLIVGGIPGVIVAALAIAAFSRIPGVSRDVAIGVVVTTLFGLGVLLALSPDSPPNIQEILFGDILGPTDADLAAAGILAAVVGGGLLALHGRLLAGGFDRGAARSLGASPGVTETALLVLLAVAIVVAVQGLGNLLVVAVFVGPAAAARQLTDRIASMIVAAIAIAGLAGLAGLYLSYYAGTAGGASVALAIVLAYLLSLPIGRLVSWRCEKRVPVEATLP
jgi:ABC-type Mn2+/Zn2+ transport system permease subunit